LFFAVECKALLVGEGLLSEDVEKITTILNADPHISTFRNPLSVYFGPADVLVNLDVNFHDSLTPDLIESTIDRIESRIKAAIPAVTRICIEAESLQKKQEGEVSPK
jgi:divalent metal cation (Fe/Co/Zn/Cd) transporter